VDDGCDAQVGLCMSLKALEITIATLLSWMSLFTDGLQSFQQQDYAKAADALSQVILSEHSQTPVGEFSRLYRAECYIQLKVPRQSHEDLAWLIHHASNETLRTRARALFVEAGGDLAEHLPRESARATVIKAMQVLQAHQELAFAEYLRGDLLASWRTWEMVVQAEGRITAIEQLAGDLKAMSIREMRTNAQGRVELVMEDASRTLELELQALDRRWRFTRLKVYAETAGLDGAAWLEAIPEELHANARTLKDFSEALELYAADNQGAYPDEIEKLVGYLKQDLTLMKWEHPASGTQHTFRYHSGLLPAEAGAAPFALMASPKGHQDVFMVWASVTDGVALFSGDALKQLLAGLDIHDPTFFAEAITAELREQVRTLVMGLQADNFKQRRTAKQGLRALGEVAFPLLREYKNIGDPEVKLTIQEILDGK
jgi:hypothetical protein